MKPPKEATHILRYTGKRDTLDGFYYLREDRKDLYMYSDGKSWSAGGTPDYFKMERKYWLIERLKPLQLENK